MNNTLKGLVLERIGSQFMIWDENHEKEIRAVCPKSLFKKMKGIYPGDRVEFRPLDEEKFRIVSVYPRSTLLSRPHVANVDRVFLVMSWAEPDFDEELFHIYRILIETHRVTVLFIMNKSDLSHRDRLQQFVHEYRKAGWEWIVLSAKYDTDFHELEQKMSGHIQVLAGPTGVGKSSILNRLIPGARLKTGDVHKKTKRGVHTTTTTRLLKLPQGGWIADTPGFHQLKFPRTFQFDKIDEYFPVLKKTPYSCKFHNCIHIHEAECGVIQAVNEGILERKWYELYRRIHRILSRPEIFKELKGGFL